MISTDPCQYSTSDQVPVNTPGLFSENQHDAAEIRKSAPLSGKQRRAYLKRERRKRKRQALAKHRECADQIENEQEPNDEEENEDEEQSMFRERERLHQEWLERERIAQEEFRLRKEKEDAARKKKEDEERRIREEWEEQQRKERELQEQKQKEKRDREKRVTGLWASSSSEDIEAVQKLLDQAESQLENGGSWKNPDAPLDFGTEKDKANCPFFIKTGACRFGDRCSRKHEYPLSSSTLMIRSMFVTFAMEQSRRDDYDTDASLEYSEEEMRQQFLDFYDDVLPELRNAGKVVQFKVSCNYEPHLRGNVYVQYETEDQCKEAFMMFNGRWYAGRQLQCEFSPVTKWKTAICGLFDRHKCPKGKHCNFLHVFQNPGNEFWEADRDHHLSSERTGGFTRWHRTPSWRGYSPEQGRKRQRDKRSRSRERCSHRWRRSRSRERRSRSRSRESQRSHHSMRRDKGSLNDRGRRSRSRERCRSRSRGRETNSQSGGRHLPTDSKTSSCTRSDSTIPEEQLKNSSIKRKRGESKSPETGNTSSTSLSHHKRSKKSKKKKKKSKKKQKRKRSKSCSVSSSAPSAAESEDDDKTPKNKDNQNTEQSGEDAEPDENIVSLLDDKEIKLSTSEVTHTTPASTVTESGPE